jgi:putative membrane protein
MLHFEFRFLSRDFGADHSDFYRGAMPVKRTWWLVLVLAQSALAHPGEPVQPHDLWAAWSFDPGVVIPLALCTFLYYLGIYRSKVIPRRGIVAFTAGLLSLVIALISPLHALGEALFSAHMIQHEILMLISAPLLVLGRPLVPFLWSLPISWRRGIGRAVKANPVRSIWRTITYPLIAWGIELVVLWVWHAPMLFEKTLTSELVHAAQHISFLVASLLFWWAVFQGGERRMGYGMSVIYIFTTAVYSGILGALLTLSPNVWYSGYADTTAAWGLTPLQDQQIGGLIMWVPAGIVYLVAALWLFARWLDESGFRMAQADIGSRV